MRKARTNHASAALNGEIYAVGGKASPLCPGWLAQAPLQPGGLSVLQQPSPTPMPLPGTREPPCWFRAPEALLPILPSGARCLGQTSHTRSPSQMVPPAARVSLGEPQAESRQPAPGGLRCIPGTLRTGQQRGPRGLGLRLPTEVAPPSPSHGLSPQLGGTLRCLAFLGPGTASQWGGLGQAPPSLAATAASPRPPLLQAPLWTWWRWRATTLTQTRGRPPAQPSNMSATSRRPAARAGSTWWAPAPASPTHWPCSATNPPQVWARQGGGQGRAPG